MKRSKILVLFLAFSFAFALTGMAQQQAEEKVTCPVSGKEFVKSETSPKYEYEGKTYYFCCEKCKEAFMKNPEKCLQKKAEMKEIYTCPMHSEVKSDKPGKCPECGMNLEKKMMAKKHMHEHKQMKMHKKEQMKMHKKEEGKACCARMGWMSSEEIEMTVENLEDGVAVKITSKNADVVKKIQEHAAKMKEMCCQKEEKKEEVKK